MLNFAIVSQGSKEIKFKVFKKYFGPGSQQHVSENRISWN